MLETEDLAQFQVINITFLSILQEIVGLCKIESMKSRLKFKFNSSEVKVQLEK